VLSAARKFNYQPNFIARSLRTRQTYSVGIIVPEFSEGYFTMVMNGVEETLIRSGYLSYVVSHQGNEDLAEEYPRLLKARSVDGLILVNTPLIHPLTLPIVCVSGHENARNVTNITLDHAEAARLALKHLYGLGHRDIVLMKGPSRIPDSRIRWESLLQFASTLGLSTPKNLQIYLENDVPSPKLGYTGIHKLLTEGRRFTAVVSFNDVAAIGAIRAIRDFGLLCPQHISVLGFDDIVAAEYVTPSLTTIRQPLYDMGILAAETLLARVTDAAAERPDCVLKPELVVRESTARALSTIKK